MAGAMLVNMEIGDSGGGGDCSGRGGTAFIVCLEGFHPEGSAGFLNSRRMQLGPIGGGGDDDYGRGGVQCPPRRIGSPGDSRLD